MSQRKAENERTCAACGKSFRRDGSQPVQHYHCSIPCRTKDQLGKPGNHFGKRGGGRKGSGCNLWKGGVTQAHRLLRASAVYRAWREAVFSRDNWTCVWCGARSGNGHRVVLHADHIKPFAMFPELRLEVSNGRTLCKDCHFKTGTYGPAHGWKRRFEENPK